MTMLLPNGRSTYLPLSDAFRDIAKAMLARQESMALARGRSVMDLPRTIAYPM